MRRARTATELVKVDRVAAAGRGGGPSVEVDSATLLNVEQVVLAADINGAVFVDVKLALALSAKVCFRVASAAKSLMFDHDVTVTGRREAVPERAINVVEVTINRGSGGIDRGDANVDRGS